MTAIRIAQQRTNSFRANATIASSSTARGTRPVYALTSSAVNPPSLRARFEHDLGDGLAGEFAAEFG